MRVCLVMLREDESEVIVTALITVIASGPNTAAESLWQTQSEQRWRQLYQQNILCISASRVPTCPGLIYNLFSARYFFFESHGLVLKDEIRLLKLISIDWNGI